MAVLSMSPSIPEKVPKVPEKVWEALVRSQVRFNRVPEKVSEKVLGAKPSQVQQVPEKVAEKVPVQGQVRFQQVQQGFQRLASQHASERFVKINVAAVCWGYHRSLFFCSFLNVGPKIWRSIPFEASPPKSVSGNFFGTPLCGRKSWARGRTAADWADDFMAKLLRTAALTSC